MGISSDGYCVFIAIVIAVLSVGVAAVIDSELTGMHYRQTGHKFG